VTHANGRFALAYLLLVIAPMAGLAGVLRSGCKLTAPAAIGGVWKMHVQAKSLPASPCGWWLTMPRDAGFTVSQSGKDFTLSFADRDISSASGTMDGTNIKADLLTSTQRAGETGCGRSLSLTASLDSKTTPNLMVGLLSVNDCPACAPAEFRAVREERTHGKGSG